MHVIADRLLGRTVPLPLMLPVMLPVMRLAAYRLGR
jgi:hypothetical protein